MKKYLSIFSLIWVLLLGTAVFAQTVLRISGKVADVNGAVVTGAQVAIKGKVQRTVITNSNGEYAFEGLPPGDYELIVTADGFERKIQKLAVSGKHQTLDIGLEIGSPNVSVTAEIGQEVERQNVPQAVNLIGSNKLNERVNPVLAQAAQEEVGVNVQKTSPTMGGVFIRGLVGAKVNVYLDGVRYTTSAQRGGVSTFFNLNESSGLQSMEILRGSSSAQYGSDALGGTVSLLTKPPLYAGDKTEYHGEINTHFNGGDLGFGGSSVLSFGNKRFGGYANIASRRVNSLRVAGGLDSHAAVTRFLGLPSNVLGERLPGTAFTQYGGAFKFSYAPRDDQQLIFYYSRNQQDGGKRYDLLLGGEGNLIAELRNLMLDLGYIRYVKQGFFGFDSASFAVSFNSQREERVNQGGQGDPLGNITHQYERTTATGFNFFLNKSLSTRNDFVIGGDIYREKINAPAYTFNPRTNIFTLSRPRVPDETSYLLGGIYVQDGWDVITERLRISGAIRFNFANYKVRAADSPVVGGFRLWGDDSLSVGDFSGRIGAVIRVLDEFKIAASYSRGFRSPSVTDLGTLGLTGDGFEADFGSASSLGGTIGSTADSSAISTGLPVSQQRSEVTNNYDFSARYRKGRFETEATVFLIDFQDAITKQALILPAGATGQFLGDQQITNQLANGVVFVGLSTAPVLIRTNFSAARIFGFEYEAEAKINSEFKAIGNYTYVRAEDKATGLPPSIEGGTPPATVFLSLRYDPKGKPFWIEAYSTLAAKQDRLSTLDISDRRTGATRTRGQIQNFFRRGACVYGLTNNADGVCGTGDETTLLLTGETLTQVQNRVLGVGINSAPMFTSLPAYGTFNLRGGLKLGEKHQIFWAFENIFDHSYRNPSWGIDGPGRSVKVGYRLGF